MKKGERRKGKKARLDEILSSKRTLEQYAKRILDERKRRREHPERYIGGISFENFYEKYFDMRQKKHLVLLTAALADGIITDDKVWTVAKP